MERLRRGSVILAVELPPSPVGEQPSDRHLVQRQRTGFVDAQDGGRAQGFDGGDTARKNSLSGDGPGAENHEDRYYKGAFGRKNRNRQGQGGEDSGDASA